MVKTKLRRKDFPFLVLIGTLFLTLPLLGGVEGDIKKSFKVSPGGLLNVDADLGSIEVRSGSVNEVNIEIRFDARSGSQRRIKELLEDFDADFQHSGSDVSVILEYRKGKMNFWDNIGRYLQVRFFITVPKKYNVDLKTSGGSIQVDDLDGKVDSNTSGGSLEFGAILGSVHGRTSGGSIKLERCDGEVDVRTSGGSISIGEVKGTVLAHTSGGGIHVEEVMGTINASTSGGSVTARISKQPEKDCSLKTSGGSITVYMTKNINVLVDASTSGGHVTTDFPVTVKGEIRKNSLRAKINEGGPELYLRTSGGSIYLRKQ
jgi:DUF4097 and DUF4098 domain-containing protein YvlB